MNKYKLKKWYPSLPNGLKEGDEVWRPKGKGCKEFWGYTTDKLAMSGTCIPVNEVENNPGFWEKVEEKDYEILSFTCDRHDRILKVGKDITTSLDHYLNKNCFHIYSIKRLSDGEIFTVEDKIGTARSNYHLKIDDIRFGYIHKDEIFLYENNRSISLENAYHAKPLFTTVDGKGIYKGDVYYHVDDGGNIHEITSKGGSYTVGYINRAFYDRTKAREFVEEHRVKYSKADVKRMISKKAKSAYSTYGRAIDKPFEEYKELVIEKCLEDLTHE